VNVKIPPVTSGTTRRHGKLLLVAQDRETARKACRTRNEARADVFDYIERFYNPASEHPSGYVIDEKRFCWLGCDPAGYFGFCRARSVMD
jgi:hypothetical protein